MKRIKKSTINAGDVVTMINPNYDYKLKVEITQVKPESGRHDFNYVVIKVLKDGFGNISEGEHLSSDWKDMYYL